MDGWRSISIGEEIGRLAASTSPSATTPPPPARPNFISARRGASATSSISFSATFSAAASCSTVRSISDAPATPRRSARCRRRARKASRSSSTRLDLSARAPARSRGQDPSSIWLTPDAWDDFGAPLKEWLDEAARALAYAIVSAISVIDVGAIVIDGAMPAACARRSSPAGRRGARKARPARPVRRAHPAGADRSRCARHRRGGAAAHQEFRAGSRRVVQGSRGGGLISPRAAIGRAVRCKRGEHGFQDHQGRSVRPRRFRRHRRSRLSQAVPGALSPRQERPVQRPDPHHRRLAPRDVARGVPGERARGADQTRRRRGRTRR